MDYSEEFKQIIKELIENSTVKQMGNFMQHYNTSCFDHCLNVAYYSYKFCKKHNLDYKSAARAGMLHDLFLYDWRKKIEGQKGLHGFTHPKTALNNAKRLFNLNQKEQDIILKHMWPLTLSLPKYKESLVVSFADKYSTLIETFEYYKNHKKYQKIYRYSYVFLSLLVFKIF